jgi:transposase, IS6 family
MLVCQRLMLTCNKLTKPTIAENHRCVKRRVNIGLGFGAFRTAWHTFQGYEAMHMLRKGQLHGATEGDVLSQHRIMAQVFGLAA